MTMSRRAFLRKGALLAPAVWAGANVILPRQTFGADLIAASPALTDVQAAVNAAVNGDRVLIPNGSATWTGPLNIGGKRIIIRAHDYTPTPAGTEGAGATTRNVTITNNSSTYLFSFTSGNDFHCGLGGIRVNYGTGAGGILSMTGSGSKPPLIFDCYFECPIRFWPAQHTIDATGLLGGVMWNMVVRGTADTSQVGEGSFLLKSSPRAWETASTLGALDVGGLVNFYLEDSTIRDVGVFPDIDDNGRFTCRHSIYDGSWAETHGFTSLFGGRHWEFCDCRFQISSLLRNIANRYFWCRAGTGIFADCFVASPPDAFQYGQPSQLQIGDNTSPRTYPQPRQPGWGHNGTTNVIDPIYIWNETGPRAYTWGFQEQPGGWENNVQLNREIFVNGGAKPGYTKFTYPHPARAVVENGSSPTSPAAPTDLSIS